MTPRRKMAAGTPAARTSVPAGVRRRRAGRSSATPSTAPVITSKGSWAVRAATRIPAPAATSMALGRRRTTGAAASPPVAGIAAGTLRSADSASPPARARNGSRPRNTQRQPKAWPTTAASDGPMIPGTTQAVDSIANMRGCSRSGRHRPIAV